MKSQREEAEKASASVLLISTSKKGNQSNGLSQFMITRPLCGSSRWLQQPAVILCGQVPGNVQEGATASSVSHRRTFAAGAWALRRACSRGHVGA
jgi:hypothetical protein